MEPTSGNTGVGLAIVAARRGYKCIFVCPDKVASDKIALLRAYGAEVIVCPTSVPPEHPESYYSVSDRLAREVPLAWKPDQYHNPNNPRAQYETAGPEIWEQTGGRVTAVVAGHSYRGLATAAFLKDRDLQVVEAMRIGPANMPRFSGNLSDSQVRDVVAYVTEKIQHPSNPGGFALGGVGPVAEGFVALLFGVGLLALIGYWIGERS